MLQFPLVKGNKAIKHKWKGNFPFSNPVSCNNIVRSTERLVQSDEESHRSLWRSKSSRMAYSCGSSQNPACTLALGQHNNCKETRHLSRNVGFWGHAAVTCGIFSLPAIYSWAGQLLVPIQSDLLIWAFICKESSIQRQRNSGAHSGAAHLRFGIWTAVFPSAPNDFKRLSLPKSPGHFRCSVFINTHAKRAVSSSQNDLNNLPVYFARESV